VLVVLTVLSLLAGVAFPGTLPLRSKLWRTTRRVGSVTIFFTMLFLGIAFPAILGFILFALMLPFHPRWALVSLILGGGFGLGLITVFYEVTPNLLEWHPPRLELAAGLVSLWALGTIIGIRLLS
jgi:hypothetical protein